MKKILIASGIVLLIAVAMTAALFLNNKQKPSVSGVALDEPTKNQVSAQLANWASYQKPNDDSYKGSFGGNPDCGVADPEFIDYIKKAENGSVFVLDLPYGLSVLYTPNYEHWTRNQFLSFSSQQMGVCGVGGSAPLSIHDDRVLWIQNRCGGAGCPFAYAGMEDQNGALQRFISDYFNK
jgi:hypothetical protein